ncbi:hypothetical protein GCM10029992_39180 [Glycomyces albus]
MNRIVSIERHVEPDLDPSSGTSERPDSRITGEELMGLVQGLVDDELFDPGDFVIAGSARLWIARARKDLTDLDIIARGSTWIEAQRLADCGNGHPANGTISGDKVVLLYGGRIEVSDRWFMDDDDTDRLIDGAELHRGLRFFSIAQVVRYKSALNRPKDREDLAALDRLGRNRKTPD